MAQPQPKADSPLSSQAEGNFPPESRHSNSPSVISSRLTDIGSEDGDVYNESVTNRTDRNRQSLNSMASRTTTGRTLPPGLNRPWGESGPTSPPSSRRGPPSVGLRNSLSGQGGLAPAGGRLSGTSMGSTGTMGRTHVSNVANKAFFRPMSSQVLQAQRGALPKSAAASAASKRESGQSIQSFGPGGVGTDDGNGDMSGLPPPSRGTEMSLPETFLQSHASQATTSPTREVHSHGAGGSMSSSVRPIHHAPNGEDVVNERNLAINTDTSYRNQSSGLAAPSPGSFRSSFLLPSRGSNRGPESIRPSGQGHEKLSSAATSLNRHRSGASNINTLPTHRHEVNKKEKNWQHFPGNTVFAFGGRWQNADDRPVNLATGFLVLVPAGLFFGFSARYLWHNINPALPIVFAYIFYLCFSSFVHASVSDPGVSAPSFSPIPSFTDSTNRFSHETCRNSRSHHPRRTH